MYRYEDSDDAEVSRRLARAMERWPDADAETLRRYVEFKMEGYTDYQARLQSGLADPSEDA